MGVKFVMLNDIFNFNVNKETKIKISMKVVDIFFFQFKNNIDNFLYFY